MLTSTLFFAASLAASVSAQSNFELPAGFNPGIVSDGEKTSWCQGQLSSCPKICPDGIASKNTCNPSSLSFTCVCGDGSTPNVAEYQNTLPFFVCEENFGQCISSHPNDLAGQKECKSQRAQFCGTKKVPSDDDDEDDSSSSSVAASSTTGDSTASTTAASTFTSKTRTTASATGKTAAKSPEVSSTAATASATSDSNGAAALGPHGAVAAALLAVAGLL